MPRFSSPVPRCPNPAVAALGLWLGWQQQLAQGVSPGDLPAEGYKGCQGGIQPVLHCAPTTSTRTA